MNMVNVLSEKTQYCGDDIVKQLHTSYCYNSDDKDKKMNILEVESDFTKEELEDGSIKRTRHEDLKHHDIENVMNQITDEMVIIRDDKEIESDYKESRPEGEFKRHFKEDQNKEETDDVTITRAEVTTDGRDGYAHNKFTIFEAKNDTIPRDYIVDTIFENSNIENYIIKAGDNIDGYISDLLVMGNDTLLDSINKALVIEEYNKEGTKTHLTIRLINGEDIKFVVITDEIEKKVIILFVDIDAETDDTIGTSTIMVSTYPGENKSTFNIIETENNKELPINYNYYTHSGDVEYKDNYMELVEKEASITNGKATLVEGTEDEYEIKITHEDPRGENERTDIVTRTGNDEDVYIIADKCSAKGFKIKTDEALTAAAPETDEKKFEDEYDKVSYIKTIQQDIITEEYDIEVNLGDNNYLNIKYMETPDMKGYLYATITKDEADHVTSIDSTDFSIDTGKEVDDSLTEIIDKITEALDRVNSKFNIK